MNKKIIRKSILKSDKNKKLFISSAIALGFFGLGAGIRPEYSVEIFWGIFLES